MLDVVKYTAMCRIHAPLLQLIPHTDFWFECFLTLGIIVLQSYYFIVTTKFWVRRILGPVYFYIITPHCVSLSVEPLKFSVVILANIKTAVVTRHCTK